MREDARIARICKLIYRIWNKEKNKDLRLMQLILNSLQPSDIVGTGVEDFYYLEDDMLEKKLEKFYNETHY